MRASAHTHTRTHRRMRTLQQQTGTLGSPYVDCRMWMRHCGVTAASRSSVRWRVGASRTESTSRSLILESMQMNKVAYPKYSKQAMNNWAVTVALQDLPGAFSRLSIISQSFVFRLCFSCVVLVVAGGRCGPSQRPMGGSTLSKVGSLSQGLSGFFFFFLFHILFNMIMYNIYKCSCDFSQANAARAFSCTASQLLLCMRSVLWRLTKTVFFIIGSFSGASLFTRPKPIMYVSYCRLEFPFGMH